MTEGDKPVDPGPGSTDDPTAKLPRAEHPEQGGYDRPGGYDQQQGGYDPGARGGYGPQGGYPQGQGQYPQDGGYHQDGGYPRGGYGQQGGYDQGGYDQGQYGPGHQGTGQQMMSSAANFAGQTAKRVQSMPWQERVMRLPGVFAVVAGFLALLSCLFPWWSMFQRDSSGVYEYSIAPFRGLRVSSANRFGDLAALNTFTRDELDTFRSITITIGSVLLIAALCLIIGGVLVALARTQVVAITLVVFGAVLLGYARVPSQIIGNFVEAASDATSMLSNEFGIIGELAASALPEARFGLGLSTAALVLATIGILIFVGMIAYRETIRIRRWMA